MTVAISTKVLVLLLVAGGAAAVVGLVANAQCVAPGPWWPCSLPVRAAALALTAVGFGAMLVLAAGLQLDLFDTGGDD